MKSFYIVLAFVLILLLGVLLSFQTLQNKNVSSNNTVKSTPTPLPYDTIENLLITEKVTDNLPKNTLEIPKEKWGEKMPALAQRVLRFFYEKGVAKKPPKDQVENYQALIKAWGKPWRVNYLMASFDREELQLIWDQLLLVQANTPEELAKQKQLVETTLAKVHPSAELPANTNLSEHFKTQQEVENAIQKGLLVQIQPKNIKLFKKEYTVKPFAQIIENNLDSQLAQYSGVLGVSSATRFVKLQNLLKEKLGYLAAKISYHTRGAAIDLKLSDDAKKRFDEYLQQKLTNNRTRLDDITTLYKQGVPLTIANLVRNGVIEKTHEIAAISAMLEETAKDKTIGIIDETFFGVRIGKDGTVTEVNPVFHLQWE